MFGHLPGLPHINNEGFYDVVLEKRGGNCPPSPPLAMPLVLLAHFEWRRMLMKASFRVHASHTWHLLLGRPRLLLLREVRGQVSRVQLCGTTMSHPLCESQNAHSRGRSGRQPWLIPGRRMSKKVVLSHLRNSAYLLRRANGRLHLRNSLTTLLMTQNSPGYRRGMFHLILRKVQAGLCECTVSGGSPAKIEETTFLIFSSSRTIVKFFQTGWPFFSWKHVNRIVRSIQLKACIKFCVELCVL